MERLPDVHRRIEVPVQFVGGHRDPFFPLPHAQEMVGTLHDALLSVIEGARSFCHEERPTEVAEALVPVLAGRV